MSYWLSNTSTLLILMQRNLKGAGVSGATPHRRPPPQVSLVGRMTMVLDFM
jgi:myosin-5